MNRLLLLFLFFSFEIAQAQTVRYVNAAATGANDGSSWANAFTKINNAINNANYGDSLWVAQGTYTPTSGTSRDSAIIIKNGVNLFAGFNGTETQLNQRNFVQYPTILSGDIGVPGDSTDNSYNVLRGSRVDTTTIIDGFIIERGNANSTATNDPMRNRKEGSGIFLRPETNTQTAAPIVRNCVFRNNYAIAGQAIHAYSFANSQGNVTLSGCKIFNNKGLGACLTISFYTGDIHISDCWFSENQSRSINILVLGDANKITIERDTFVNNSNNNQYVQITNVDAFEWSALIDKCVFKDNGLAVLTISGVSGNNHVTISNCDISNNFSFSLESNVGNLLFVNNKIYQHNNCRLLQGANNKMFTLANNIFLRNKRYDLDIFGNFLCSNNEFKSNKLKWLLSSPNFNLSANVDARFTNNVFYDNKLSFNVINFDPSMAGFRFQSCSFIRNAPLVDTIPMFWLNDGDSLTFNSCVFTENSSSLPLIRNKKPNQYISAYRTVFESPSCTQIIADNDPNICAADNIIGATLGFMDTINGDYRLLPCAQGINFGDPTVVLPLTDFSGQPRIANGLPDVGALETTIEYPVATITDAECYGKSNGSITYDVTDCNSYSYTWTNDQGQSGTGLQGLSAGQYDITLTSQQNDLVVIDSATINEPPNAWQFSYSSVQPSGPTMANGSISILVGNGAAPYTYAWNTGAATPVINQLLPGTYAVTITDANGCRAVYVVYLDAVGTEETKLKVIRYFPNPVVSGGRLQLESMDNAAQLLLLDATGRLVHTVPSQGGQCRIPEQMARGLFIALAIDAKGRTIGMGKIVVVE
jgi:hypothetical protein